MDPRPEPVDDGDLLRRACDPCRMRKIRCDRRSPCSNCTTARYQCLSSNSVPRPREARHRVLISSQYEKKIDHIEARLDKITNIVERIAHTQSCMHTLASSGTLNNLVESPFVAPIAPVTRSETEAANDIRQDSGSEPGRRSNGQPFEGSSSVTAHATFAGEFIEDTVTRHARLDGAHPNMRGALVSLKKLLSTQSQHSAASETRLAHAKPLGPGGLRQLPLVPSSTIVEILRELKKQRPVTFTLICVFDSVDYFTEQCRKVYFATEDFSQATFVAVNAGLYYILQEKAALAMQSSNEAEAEDYRRHSELCRDNLETALQAWSLLMSPRKENVEALVMAASYATEISKPSLAWQLNTAASQICLALGYHRKGLLPDETEQTRNKRAVMFWLVYILDKALGLRFGRSSILQDYDITLSRTLEPLGEFEEHRETIQGWITHAYAQSLAYENLYSPAALSRPVEQRVRSANDCAVLLLGEARKLRELQKQQGSDDTLQKTDDRDVIYSLLLKSDEVSILSTLALVYRAVPPGTMGAGLGSSCMFNVECLEVSRDVVQKHLECIDVLVANPQLAHAHMHWAILFSPFIPFIVLFCHAIENYHLPDLSLVGKFKASLEPFRRGSEPIDRLYRLCEVLYTVAVLYFQTKQSQRERVSFGEDRHQDGAGLVDSTFNQECDVYFYQMGLIPGEHGSTDRFELETESSSHEAETRSTDPRTLQIANWYFGFTNMAGWSELSPSAWPQG